MFQGHGCDGRSSKSRKTKKSNTRWRVSRSGRRLQVPLLVLREYRSTVPIGVEGVPTLSGFSESPGPSCHGWYLRVTLTPEPERPSYNSCIVHWHLLHPAHQIQAHTKADIAERFLSLTVP